MKKLLIILMLVFCFSFISAATYYVDDPNNCPATDATNYPGQDCSPNDICGDISGTAQCADTSLITPPTSNTTSSSSLTASFGGGYLTNCYRTTTCDVGLCNRNTTCYTTNHRNTNCIANDWAKSDCGTCRTNWLDCNTATYNCEIGVGVTCGVGNTGTYAGCNGTLGNCTSSVRLDCNNDDNDGNVETCNGASDGCEILIGGSCSVGTLTGTYSSTCTGSVGTCVVSKSYFETGTLAEYLTTVAQSAMLWFKNFNADGWLINATNANDETWGINNDSCMVLKDGTEVCGQGDLGNSTFNQTFTDEKYVPYQGANADVNLTDVTITAGYDSVIGNVSGNANYFKFEEFNDGTNMIPYLKAYSYVGALATTIPYAFVTDVLVVKQNDLGIVDPAIALINMTGSIFGTIGIDVDGTGNMIFTLDNSVFEGGNFIFTGGNVDASENISTDEYFVGSGKYLTDLPAGGNLSFNQSLTDTLYSDIEWGYNQTYSGSTYNATYAGSVNNASYLSTYNATYNTWAYNQTDAVDTSGLVPYTGATTNVDLGNNNLTSRTLHSNELRTIEGYFIGIDSSIHFLDNRTTSSTGEIIGNTYYQANDEDGSQQTYAQTSSVILDNSSSTGDSSYRISTKYDGVTSPWFVFSGKDFSSEGNITGQYIMGDGRYLTGLGSAINGSFVPYSGAVSNVNLNTKTLLMNGTLTLDGTSSSGQIRLKVGGESKWNIKGFSSNIQFLNYQSGDTEMLLYMPTNSNDSRLGINMETAPEAELHVDGSGLFSRNVTADYYFGDGSELSNLPAGGNLSFNQSLTSTLYSDIKWGYNHTTIIETNYGKWFYNMTQPFTDWLSSFVYNYNQTIPANSYTDSQDVIFNTSMKNYVDAEIGGITSGNLSWNESRADELYSDIKWGYNFSLSTFSMWNSTWDNSFMNIWNYNQTTIANDYTDSVVSANNDSWSSTYNATYNEYAYNQTYSGSTYNSTYAIWSYNQTSASTYNTPMFINYTNVKTTGNMTNGSAVGYAAGTAICNSEIPGSHMCTTDEVIEVLNLGTYGNFTATFRVSEGPPGYTANADDCSGWKSSSTSFLGAVWVGNSINGGSGALVSCSAERAIGCCK